MTARPSEKARELILDAVDGSPYENGKIKPGVRALQEYIAELETKVTITDTSTKSGGRLRGWLS